LLGGTADQRRYNPRSWRRYHGDTDHRRAIDLATHVCASDAEANALLKLLEIQTTQIVDLHWPEIEALAGELLKRRRMNVREIKQFFETGCGSTIG
jgi:hypothetical protein